MIILSGQEERLRLIDPGLYDEVLSYDLARRDVARLAEKADLSVAFSAGAMEGFQVRRAPFPADRTNIYDYMRNIALSLGGDAAAILRIPEATGKGLIIHPGSGSAAKNAPLEFFLEEAHRGNHPTFLLGPAEAASMERLISAAGFVWKRPETLLDMKKLILDHDSFLGNDSGPAHLAALGGLSTRICYRGSDPADWLPPGNVVVMKG